jgi:HD-GYP domain-containing protein (c-di-GMP phosphodiesterase class II)
MSRQSEEIPIEARIMAAADAVKAMTSDRPYHPGLKIDKALEGIEKKARVSMICRRWRPA